MEMASTVVTYGCYAIKLLWRGNKEDAESQLSADIAVEAEVATGVAGSSTRGYHVGVRSLSAPMRSFGKIFKKGKYTEYMVIPNGKGEFHSEDLWYKGNFLNGQFHDLSKEASCHIKDQRNGNIQVFKGCFKNGQRHDYGELSLLFAGRLEPLLYYKGWWAHDEPDTGDFFNAEGNVFTRIERGVLGGVSLSNSGPTPPPPVPLRGEERRPRLQPDVHDAGTTPTTIGLVLPARVSSCAPDPSFLPDDQQVGNNIYIICILCMYACSMYVVYRYVV